MTARSTANVNKLRPVLRRLPASVLVAVTALLVSAAPSLAHDTGEGWWGETNDRVVTNAGFILIIFFVGWIFVMSVVQWQLEKRKDRRKAEAKRRAANAAGGW
jgi:small-conductance mechanosensitive channel